MKKVIIVGAGINGLVAANYLQRAGFAVTILERKEQVGGACSQVTLSADGIEYLYADGASVLGMMQDFVFEETDLRKHVSVYAPSHPAMVYFPGENQPCHLYHDAILLKRELHERWGENGNVEAFVRDREVVRQFLIAGFKNAKVPTIADANEQLGYEMAERWILGSARSLLDYYFTAAQTKLLFSTDVTESGPVPLDSPYSAFSMALMSSGTIFDGDWGFVKGGIWKIAEALASINLALGVKIITQARVLALTDSKKHFDVTYEMDGKSCQDHADLVLFASDPLTAAKLTNDRALEKQILTKQFLGTSAKLVLIFKNPVRWLDATSMEDFDAAFRFIFTAKDLDEFETSSESVKSLRTDYSSGYLEIYCEGAGQRKLGEKRDYDLVYVFFKNVGFSKTGVELPAVTETIEKVVLSKIENADDLIQSVLLTPKDIQNIFFIPEGNIDHIELCAGQTFFDRNFSPHPENSFYQFGKNSNLYYCAAGSYPCGSIAGTPGYMCAQQIIRKYA